jgi:hypothetical protein
MKYFENRDKNVFRLIFPFVLLISFLSTIEIFGQEPPPRPITITVSPQGLSFGAFTHGALGGSVIIDPDGTRTSTGDVVLLNLGFTYTSALYEIDANPGTVISVLYGPGTTLAGSGGGTMVLTIGSSLPASPFVTTAVPPAKTSFYLGGTLSVGNPASNPPGNYTGTFLITFNQE